ncbi:MAG: cobalamin-dependent protein [Bacillota bacterium]
MEVLSDNLANLIADLKETEVNETVDEWLKAGKDPVEILNSLSKGLEIVGKRFENGEYFIPDLIYAGEIVKNLSETIKPNLAGKNYPKEERGKFLIGTVEGDIHDIGKDIVAFMMDVNGFEVLDLGVDVSKDKFVEEIKSFQPDIVGLSGFLTLAFDAMKKTVQTIEEAGLRENLKIMIGGGQMSEEIADYCNADVYQPDAVSAVNQAKKWMGGE